MQSHRHQHTYQGLKSSIQERPVRQNSTVYQQIQTSTCQEVERHFQEGPGVILCCVVLLRHTEKKRQTFQLVFQQLAIGESIDEEGNERLEVFYTSCTTYTVAWLSIMIQQQKTMIPATKLLRSGIIWRLGTFDCLFWDNSYCSLG
jgi:hypothetical protein